MSTTRPTPNPSAATPDMPSGPEHSLRPADTVPPHTTSHILDSTSLLRGNSSVAITHRGAVYRLQATRQGKLILTK